MHRRTWGTSILLSLLVMTSLVGMDTAPASAQTTTSTSTTPTTFEADVQRYVNRHRAAIGCPTLTFRSSLTYAARRHTKWMVDARTLSHQLPGEMALGKRITYAGYTPWRILAENLAMGPSTAYGVYKLWMGSGPHRANIENCSLRNASLGVTMVNGRSWSTMDFGRQ